MRSDMAISAPAIPPRVVRILVGLRIKPAQWVEVCEERRVGLASACAVAEVHDGEREKEGCKENGCEYDLSRLA